MKSLQRMKGYTISEILIGGIYCFGVIGYILNLTTLVTMNVDPITIELIIRVVGLFVFPVGCIMGFIPGG